MGLFMKLLLPQSLDDDYLDLLRLSATRMKRSLIMVISSIPQGYTFLRCLAWLFFGSP